MLIKLVFVVLISSFIRNSESSVDYPGHPISILSFGNTSSDFEFDSAKLDELLSSDDVKNRQIAIFSIAGAFRKGKSFALDYFLRYLYTNYRSVGSAFKPFREDQQNWLGDADEPLKGFSWKSGSIRHTTGIVLWSDIFLYDAPNGDNIAILLMDTQGLFDHESSPTDNARIFSLSTLISSTQIFNLFNHIQEDQLQYLQFATDFAKYVTNDTQAEKPFQNLMFLIRDWNYPEDYEYGLEGGQNLLNEVMKITDNQLYELKSLRQYIYASFEKISCFLMPYPGKIVASKSNFDGRWSKIDVEFLDQLKVLVETLFSPANLNVKKINGESLEAQNLMIYIKQYVQMFKSDDLPKTQSLYEATITNHMNILINKAYGAYKEAVQQSYSGLKEKYDIYVLHGRAQDKGLKLFVESKKMGTEEHATVFMEKLKNLIIDDIAKWKETATEHINEIQEENRKIEEAAAEKRRLEIAAELVRIQLEMEQNRRMQKVREELEKARKEAAEAREAERLRQEEYERMLENLRRRAEDARQEQLENERRQTEETNRQWRLYYERIEHNRKEAERKAYESRLDVQIGRFFGNIFG